LEPSLLLLDEPLANIDQQSKESIRKDLFDIIKDIGRSALYVTHDRNEAMTAGR
jgi:iron(III) transport system ATP-binding protein